MSCGWGCAAVLVLAIAMPAEASAVSRFYGNWRIASIAGFGEISSGQSSARQALGQRVYITANSIILPDDPCTGHPLSYDIIPVDLFLKKSWQMSRSDLKLGSLRLAAAAAHIDAECADALVLDRNHLLISSGAGAYYIVRRTK